jgi:hypothetical protein
MWIFGYGSLMWDSWEQNFGCLGKEEAQLESFRRDFNKASTFRWGSRSAPVQLSALNQIEMLAASDRPARISGTKPLRSAPPWRELQPARLENALITSLTSVKSCVSEALMILTLKSFGALYKSSRNATVVSAENTSAANL